jgi:hypothetical protein
MEKKDSNFFDYYLSKISELQNQMNLKAFFNFSKIIIHTEEKEILDFESNYGFLLENNDIHLHQIFNDKNQEILEVIAIFSFIQARYLRKEIFRVILILLHFHQNSPSCIFRLGVLYKNAKSYANYWLT